VKLTFTYGNWSLLVYINQSGVVETTDQWQQYLETVPIKDMNHPFTLLDPKNQTLNSQDRYTKACKSTAIPTEVLSGCRNWH
jgi:hypothetical protein